MSEKASWPLHDKVGPYGGYIVDSIGVIYGLERGYIGARWVMWGYVGVILGLSRGYIWVT